jgi:hypothetical protein
MKFTVILLAVSVPTNAYIELIILPLMMGVNDNFFYQIKVIPGNWHLLIDH